MTKPAATAAEYEKQLQSVDRDSLVELLVK